MSNALVLSTTYTVQTGDFLCAIAQKFYGNGSEASWRKIYEANKAIIGTEPTQLEIGMVLEIPANDGGTSDVISRMLELVNTLTQQCRLISTDTQLSVDGCSPGT